MVATRWSERCRSEDVVCELKHSKRQRKPGELASGECCWLAGFLIDVSYQRRGYGRQAIQAALVMLAEEHGFQHWALSYSPDNPAKQLYHEIGFTETNERERDEVVARLPLAREGPD